MKVLCAKLSSGEEVIGRVLEVLNNELKLEYVRSIVLVGHGQQTGLSLIPFAAGNPDAALTLNRDLVVTEYEPISQLETAYLNETSAITLAPASAVGSGLLKP